MKSICLGYLESDKFENMPESITEVVIVVRLEQPLL